MLDFFRCEFIDLISSSVQDLAASSVAKELRVDEVECDMHQGDKVGASAVEELSRACDKVNMFVVCIVLV